MEDDLERYEGMRAEGVTASDACVHAIGEGASFALQIRMLRSVYSLDIAEARDTAAQASIRSDA